jgi:hypothetical protein
MERQMQRRSHSRKKKLRTRIRVLSGTLILVGSVFALNFLVQIARKPAEALGMLGLGKSRSISETWRVHSRDFRKHATEITAPTFLAAMAQVESSGNALATPKWRFRWSGSWWRWFAPESTSVGLFQLTDGAYDRAKTFCIHKGQVVRDGPWHDWDSCWFNWSYLRISASDSIEMTSAYLHHEVVRSLAGRKTSLKNQRRLAAVIHLCGPGRARAFIRSEFALSSAGYCGRHSVRRYVESIERYERQLRPAASRSSVASPAPEPGQTPR